MLQQVQGQAGGAGGNSRGALGDSKSQYDKCSISDFTQGPILGTGSFGRVLLATHRHTGRICAIKALSKAHLVRNQQASGLCTPPSACSSSLLHATISISFPFAGAGRSAGDVMHSMCWRHAVADDGCCMQVAHLKAERDVLRMVCHPGLVNYLGGFQDGACVYFIMEYVSGGEFFRHLKMRVK